MLGIWAVQLGQPPCKLAGLERKSHIALEFRAALSAAQSLEGCAKRDSIVKPLSSSACHPQDSTFLNFTYPFMSLALGARGGLWEARQRLHFFHWLCELRGQL